MSTDNGIIMARHRLIKAAKALRDKGVPPPATEPSAQKVRSASVVLPVSVAFKDAATDVLLAREGVAQSSV